MYLSRVHLKNWRSYEDAEFEFQTPTKRKPITIIGAMNGSGKTSFLISLFLGLYGAYGLRYCEGFDSVNPEELKDYKKAMKSFRRKLTSSDTPTSVELVFSRCIWEDRDIEEVRIIRRWYFRRNGEPKSGDDFEEAVLFVNDKVVDSHSELAIIANKIEQFLFPPNFMPAFFFDGEQAQTLVNNVKGEGIRKAVEVMFGTKLLSELHRQIDSYVQDSVRKLGGKKEVSALAEQLQYKQEELDRVNSEIAKLQADKNELSKQLEEDNYERDRLEAEYSRIGGKQAKNREILLSQLKDLEYERKNVHILMNEKARLLALALGLSRLGPTVRSQLRSEKIREGWEQLREGTIKNQEIVLERALPKPRERDPLLMALTDEQWIQLRDRYQESLEAIYEPPPKDCVSEYRLGHLKANVRLTVLDRIDNIMLVKAADIENTARMLSDLDERYAETQVKFSALEDLPIEKAEEIHQKMCDLNERISTCIRNEGEIDNRIKNGKETLRNLSVEIGNLNASIVRMGPDKQRIQVAENVKKTLYMIDEQVKPLIIERMQEELTASFVMLADRRYKNCSVRFDKDDGEPIILLENGTTLSVKSMSGYERRTFGIAFTFALTRLTGKRMPLVIDTPLGNADSEYRPRLLKEMTKVDLDQVIILSHDEEVDNELIEPVRDNVRQLFLVEFSRKNEKSVVHPDKYFG